MSALSAPRLLALIALAWAAPVQAMDYQYGVDNGRLVVQAAGNIELNEAQRFLDFTGSLPPPVFKLFNGKSAVIVFNSTGGRLGAAFHLANILMGYRVTTRVGVGDQCASACVVVWAAGAHKTAAPDAVIEVHSAGVDGTAGDNAAKRKQSREATLVMAQWLRRAGAPDNVFRKTIDTPPEGPLYRLTPEDLAAWKVEITQ